jgi:hypothetical protein
VAAADQENGGISSLIDCYNSIKRTHWVDKPFAGHWSSEKAAILGSRNGKQGVYLLRDKIAYFFPTKIPQQDSETRFVLKVDGKKTEYLQYSPETDSGNEAGPHVYSMYFLNEDFSYQGKSIQLDGGEALDTESVTAIKMDLKARIQSIKRRIEAEERHSREEQASYKADPVAYRNEKLLELLTRLKRKSPDKGKRIDLTAFLKEPAKSIASDPDWKAYRLDIESQIDLKKVAPPDGEPNRDWFIESLNACAKSTDSEISQLAKNEIQTLRQLPATEEFSKTSPEAHGKP